MDDSSGYTPPPAGLSMGGATDPPITDLDRARERLAFYESFDRLIQENISRAAELLRQAMALRETTANELEEARAELEQRATASRERERTTLAFVHRELGDVQQRVVALTQRVEEALASIDSPIAAESAAEADSGDTTTYAATQETESGEGEPPRPVENPTISLLPPAAWPPIAPFESAVPEMADPPNLNDLVDAEIAASLGQRREERFAPSGAADILSQPTPLLGRESSRPSALRPMMVLVHGVPRAATALSLQRHLASLEHVATVEAREYAEGILRLQVFADPPLRLEDVQGWAGGGPLEPLHILDDVIEVRMPGVPGA